VENSSSENNPKDYTLGEIDILIPLPFFWENAPLPTTCTPYTKLVIEIEFRDLKELLVYDKNFDNYITFPNICEPQVHASYTVCSSMERKCLSNKSHKILINSMEKLAEEQYINGKSYNIKSTNTIRGLMFGVRRNNEFSNYASNINTSPIKKAILSYNKTNRIIQDSNYFTFLNPLHHAPAIPKDIGYHLYSYAQDVTGIKQYISDNTSSDSVKDFKDLKEKDMYKPAYSLSACGSTNYEKLHNVTMTFEKPKDTIINENDTIIIYGLTHKFVNISKGEFSIE
jgi:hypothetical protein